MDDQKIIELYFARDEQAISATAEKYGVYCHTIAMNVLASRPDAEECVNDTYLKAWQSMPPQRPSVLRLFLGRITRNLALDKYRRNQVRGREHMLPLDELAECLPVKESDADELPLLFNGFLATLPETDRRLFVLRYWHGHSVKVLANRFGLTANAVSVRLYKTREKLRAYLEERGYRV